jgi:hypothetical protein
VTSGSALPWLLSLRPALPMSVERPCTPASNGEVRRWCTNRAVIVNGSPIGPDDELPATVQSLVLFPRSPARRCTLY